MFERLKGRLRRVRISPATVIATVALVVAMGGVAHSAIPGPDGLIYACYVDDSDPDFSYLYLADHNQNCQPGETAIQWSKETADQAKASAAESQAAAAGTELGKADALFAGLKKATAKLDKAINGALTKKDLKPFNKRESKALAELGKSQDKMFNSISQMNGVLDSISKVQQRHNEALIKAIGSIRF